VCVQENCTAQTWKLIVTKIAAITSKTPLGAAVFQPVKQPLGRVRRYAEVGHRLAELDRLTQPAWLVNCLLR
jgi:hypothetical protein